jgi:large subunit ribosomal protein L10
LAFTKKHKSLMVEQYDQWLNKSQAMFVMEYSKMNMKSADALRAKVREAGGELHVVKNTIFNMSLDKAGIHDHKLFDGSSIVGFAFSDAPALAKVLAEATKNSEIFKVKGGYLGTERISPQQVKALADLPPLPVMRARLLGVISAPASQIVRTLAEPARQVAAVIKAHSEAEAAPAA